MSKFDPYEHLNISLNTDGTLNRLIEFPKIKATGDAEHSSNETVVSKDATLNVEKKTWIRIFRPTKLPSNDNSVARLPIMLYFHGGGFILFSVSDAMTHANCENISTEVSLMVVIYICHLKLKISLFVNNVNQSGISPYQ